MNLSFKKTTCRVLALSVFALSVQSAHAGLIGAEQAAGGTPSAERTMLLGTLDRADVIAQLQAAGVDPQSARERINTMSEAEVQAMAQDIQTAPAAALPAAGWVAIILVAALIWYYAYRK